MLILFRFHKHKANISINVSIRKMLKAILDLTLFVKYNEIQRFPLPRKKYRDILTHVKISVLSALRRVKIVYQYLIGKQPYLPLLNVKQAIKKDVDLQKQSNNLRIFLVSIRQSS